MQNRVLDKFRAGEKSIGTFTHLLSAPAIEAMAYTGLDYVIIDMEHSPIVAEHAAELVGVAAGAGIAPFVRVDAIERSPVLKMLDVGAAGLIVPRCGDRGRGQKARRVRQIRPARQPRLLPEPRRRLGYG